MYVEVSLYTIGTARPRLTFFGIGSGEVVGEVFGREGPGCRFGGGEGQYVCILYERVTVLARYKSRWHMRVLFVCVKVIRIRIRRLGDTTRTKEHKEEEKQSWWLSGLWFLWFLVSGFYFLLSLYFSLGNPCHS